MQCPICKTSAPLGSRACPHCGADFSVLQSFNKIKQEWRRTKEDFSARLNRLQDQFDEFETLLTASPAGRAQSPALSSEPQASGSSATASPGPGFPEPGAQADPVRKAPPTPTAPPPLEPPPADRNTEVQFGQKWLLLVGIAITVLGLGFVKDQALLRQCALVLFAATTLKVFFWDMANVSTPFRIVSFIVLGLMLIGASYLYHRYRERLVSTGPEEGLSS